MGEGGLDAVNSGRRDPLILLREIFSDSDHCEIIGQTMCHQLGGLAYDVSINPYEKMLETAKVSIRNFELVGFSDRMDHFYLQVENMLGKKLDFTSRNRIGDLIESKAVLNDLHRFFSQDIRRKIKGWCEKDIELYQFAKSTFS